MRSCLAVLVLLAGLVVGCESPPEERSCRAVSGEGSVDFDCEGSDPDWQDRALDEADEGMERRGPGGRP